MLHHVWAGTGGSYDLFSDFIIVGVVLLALLLRFLWRVAGILAGQNRIG